MKRFIRVNVLLLLVTALVFCFSSCVFEKVKIENYEWQMRYVMHGENDQVVIDAVQEESSVYPQAKIIDMKLTANDGRITIVDVTNDKSYEGTYLVENKTPEGTDYKVVIDGKTGYATVAMTTYADGTEEPTLPINLGDYSIYFYAE